MGIEPTGDGTRLPDGFEDHGVHQYLNRPHLEFEGYCLIITFYVYVKQGINFSSSR